MSSRIYVIGIGYKPLDKRAREIILNSTIILSSSRLFEVFKGYDEFEKVKDRVKVINNVDETIEFIRAEVQKSGESKGFRASELPNFRAIVLLASGDPMFFGIGRRSVREFGKDMVEIIPDLSSIQIAFSRIKEPWDDAFLISLHGGPDPEKRRRLPYEITDIPLLLQRHNKIAILTDKENNPTIIAKSFLKSSAPPHFHTSALKIYVCERLGYPDERIIEGTPEEIANRSFHEPNVVIILRDHHPSPITHRDFTFGLREKEIFHSKGLITKDEVRAVSVHKLRLPQKGVFWDIGAGSGSISVEVARLYPDLDIFAIEKDKEQTKHIRENMNRFNIRNIKIIEGEAPDVLQGLPLPERVFIGGSGDKLKEILDFVIKRMVRLIVINSTTIETLTEAIQCFENHGYNVEISEISVSRSKNMGRKRHMSALNPIFIIMGEKC